MILWLLLLSGMPGDVVDIEVQGDIQSTYPLITQAGQTHIAVDADNTTYHSHIYIFESSQTSIRTGRAIPVDVSVEHAQSYQSEADHNPVLAWIVAAVIILITIKNAVDSSTAAPGSREQ